MADVASICAVCGGSGFLMDKVSFFPFAAGIALGVAFVSAAPDLFSALRARALVLSKAAKHGSVDAD
jgi:hypothetical protein